MKSSILFWQVIDGKICYLIPQEQIRLNKLFANLRIEYPNIPKFTHDNNSIDEYFSDYSVVENDWIISPMTNRFIYKPFFGKDKTVKTQKKADGKHRSYGYSAKKLMTSVEV
jgi:hypothetical protein